MLFALLVMYSGCFYFCYLYLLLLLLKFHMTSKHTRTVTKSGFFVYAKDEIDVNDFSLDLCEDKVFI